MSAAEWRADLGRCSTEKFSAPPSKRKQPGLLGCAALAAHMTQRAS
jgi:hypothetical protein